MAWRAGDLVLGRTVALKLINNPSWAGRLHAEFSAVQGLVHPNLVRALDYEVDIERGDALEFLVYEVVSGQTLERYARQLSWSELQPVIADILAGLGFLHALGVAHGDVKANNVLVTDDGRGVLIDFGCARRFGPTFGAIAGTAGYIPPELAAGGKIDGRNDLFALGVTVERLLPQLKTPPDGRMLRLLRRLCARDVAQRPATVAEVLELFDDSRAVQLAPAGRSARLLGRDTELESFERELNDWLHRGARPVSRLLWGPSGIGKSRLLQQLKWTAQSRVRVVEGSSALAEWSRALRPWPNPSKRWFVAKVASESPVWSK